MRMDAHPMTMLSTEGLNKKFGGLHAVRDVSFSVAAGEILGLIGPNGAGKTTVFGLLSGFIRQDTGEVRLGGELIDSWSPEARCEAGLVRTFQIVRPFGNITVLENVAIGAMLRTGSRAQARRDAAGVLERVGLADRAQEIARGLPIGIRKRLEVAKALATRPKVMLLDEIMGGLIPTEVNEMMGLLRQLRADGAAVVLIEHNMHAVMTVSDRVVVLNHGAKIAEGTAEQVSRNSAVISAYLGEDYDSAQDH